MRNRQGEARRFGAQAALSRRVRRYLPAICAAASATLAIQSMAGVTVTAVSYTAGNSWDSPPTLATMSDNLGSHTLVPEGFDDSRVESQTFKPTSSFTLDKLALFIGGGSGDGGFPTVSLHLYDLNNIDVSSPNTITGYDVDTASGTGDLFGGGAGLPFFVPGSPNNRIMTFDLDGPDQVVLQANHLYAFEIWGTSGLATPFYWNRVSGGDFTAGDPYTGGNGYFAVQNIDPDTTHAPRGRVAGNNRDFFLAVYAVPAAGAAWNVDADGNWSTGSNWNPATAPNAAGVTATFGAAILAPRTVTVDAPQTVGTVAFDNANKYTIAGSSTLTLDNTSGGVAMTVTTGSHDITAPVALAKDATVTVTPAGSTLTVSNLQASAVGITKAGAGNLAVNNVRAGTLTVNAGTVTVLSNGGDAGVSKAALAIAGGTTPTATLDLTNNDLVTSAAKATVEAQVKSARNNGAWTGQGITSTAARNLSTTGLGVLSGAEYSSVGGTGTFSGQTYAAGDTLVKYTWNGDANFSGTVTFDDYVKIDTGFNQQLTGWLNGDFNYSGNVSFDDYVLIDTAFNQQNGTLGRAVDWISGDDRSSAGLDTPGMSEVLGHLDQFGGAYASAFLAAVPEPTSLALLVVPAVASMVRRRRRA